MKKLVITSLSIALLSGCAGLEKGINDFNESMAAMSDGLTPEPVMVTDTAGRICQEASKNELRAEKAYVGKGIVVQGVIASNFTTYNAFSKTFTVTKNDEISYLVSSEGIDTNKLNKGDTINLKGVITAISTAYPGCSIYVSKPGYNANKAS
ncbi:OB-fold protein [Vibrio alginolyticus]